MRAYLLARGKALKPSTLKQYDLALLYFLQWWADHLSQEPLLEDLTRNTLDEYHSYQEKRVSALTAHDRLRKVEAWWRWCADDDEYFHATPRPRRLELRACRPELEPRAPTWTQMDAAIVSANSYWRTEWYGRLWTVLRFTGLRQGQAMQLLWEDVNLEDATLRIRRELGKSKQEQAGRVVALSSHLIDELAGWGRREGFLIDVGDNKGRTPHSTITKKLWARTGAPHEVWRQPSHCFRKGFISGLAEAGVREDVIKALVGHTRGVTGDVYTPHHRLLPAMREAVAVIPPLGQVEEEKVVSLEVTG